MNQRVDRGSFRTDTIVIMFAALLLAQLGTIVLKNATFHLQQIPLGGNPLCFTPTNMYSISGKLDKATGGSLEVVRLNRTDKGKDYELLVKPDVLNRTDYMRVDARIWCQFPAAPAYFNYTGYALIVWNESVQQILLGFGPVGAIIPQGQLFPGPNPPPPSPLNCSQPTEYLCTHQPPGALDYCTWCTKNDGSGGACFEDDKEPPKATWTCPISQFATPLPELVTSFLTTQQNNCSKWFHCPQKSPDAPALFSQVVAQDAVNWRDRVGPTSLLPRGENQMVVRRFDLGFVYAMWIDARPATPKVINCTRQAVDPHANRTAWEYGFTGSLRQKAAFLATVPCNNGQTACQLWTLTTQFPIQCPTRTYTGHENQLWTLAPKEGRKFALYSYTNDNAFPVDAPVECFGGERTWWHQNLTSYVSNPGDDVFAVPSDVDCPLNAGAPLDFSSWALTPAEALARPVGR
jgi:hypothetical protein